MRQSDNGAFMKQVNEEADHAHGTITVNDETAGLEQLGRLVLQSLVRVYK